MSTIEICENQRRIIMEALEVKGDQLLSIIYRMEENCDNSPGLNRLCRKLELVDSVTVMVRSAK